MDIKKEIVELLDSCSFLSVASITENGYPRVAILVKVKTEGYKEIYFCTGKSSAKVTNYKRNRKAGVTFYNQSDSVTMTGKMIIIVDEKVKNELWQDWMTPHFPKGGKDDPEYCIIKFEAEEATVCIKNHFETFLL